MGTWGRAWQVDGSLRSPPSTLCPALIYFLLCPQALSTPGRSGAQVVPQERVRGLARLTDGMGGTVGGALPGGNFRSFPGVPRSHRRCSSSRNSGPGLEPQAGVGAGWASPGGLDSSAWPPCRDPQALSSPREHLHVSGAGRMILSLVPGELTLSSLPPGLLARLVPGASGT